MEPDIITEGPGWNSALRKCELPLIRREPNGAEFRLWHRQLFIDRFAAAVHPDQPSLIGCVFDCRQDAVGRNREGRKRCEECVSQDIDGALSDRVWLPCGGQSTGIEWLRDQAGTLHENQEA